MLRGSGVAAAVAVLEKQASLGSRTTKTTPSVKTQQPQDNCASSSEDDEEERSRKSASPLSRSESFKRLSLNGVERSDSLKRGTDSLKRGSSSLKRDSDSLKRDSSSFKNNVENEDYQESLVANTPRCDEDFIITVEARPESLKCSSEIRKSNCLKKTDDFQKPELSALDGWKDVFENSVVLKRNSSLRDSKSTQNPSSKLQRYEDQNEDYENIEIPSAIFHNKSDHCAQNYQNSSDNYRNYSNSSQNYPNSYPNGGQSYQTVPVLQSVSQNGQKGVKVISAKLKPPSICDVDALCSDLMLNLEEALNEKKSGKTSRSGFAYVDLREEPNNIKLRTHPEDAKVEEYRNSSSTNESAVTSEDLDSEDSDEEDTESSDETESSSSDEERVHHIHEGLETITEEDRPVTASSVRSIEAVETSSPDDDSTLKGHGTWSGTASNHDSTSDLSTSSSDQRKPPKDSSAPCNDFQWIHKTSVSKSPSPSKMEPPPPSPVGAKPPINRQLRDRTPRRHSEKMAPGSLDRRRVQQNRHDRDQKSKSTHVPKRMDDQGHYGCQNWCCNPHAMEPNFENFHRRHERIDPSRYGSSSMLLEQSRHEFYMNHGSHPDLYSDFRFRHEPVGCCAYHAPPPPPPQYCRCADSRNYHWTTPSKPPDQDDRLRRLQGENDNLQKEVFVLNERIEAQCDKIAELERALSEKKQLLGNAEDLLQREMLSRSSLETQKLELMSAMSELKLQQAALERENVELRNSQYNNNTVALIGLKKPPLKPRASPQPALHTSTPVLHSSNQMLSTSLSPSPSPVSPGITASLSQRRIEISPILQEPQAPKTPPATFRRQVDMHYGSLPRQQFLSNGGSNTAVDTNANPSTVTVNGTRTKGVAFAETEKIVIEDTPVHDSTNNLSPQPSPSLQINKNRGIKKIFGRMKRSGSGNLEDLPVDSEFRRGGVRATAGPRLGWNEPQQLTQRPDIPFPEWDTDTVCDWLQELGLESYITEAKRWIKTGAQLQAASTHDIEKELSIKNALHKKKLQLALLDMTETSSDPYLSSAGQLDTAWVLRWLDDTGLPQHKETFLLNRVDGRVLHRLTMDDLASLHITSVLHVASLKRGIQVLREHNFEPGCLHRRSLPEDPTEPTAQIVALWTTHRVMEWLRAVDLAEYAPNLRGAGVHGGLMVLEPKFTAELLASLLSIPPSKTLLRRHLNTHFKELLGRDCIQEKREAETTLGYIPLTPAAKLKVTKKSQFSLKKKKDKGEMDFGDLVCPLIATGSQSGESNGSSSTSTSRDSVGTTKIDTPKVEVVCHLVDDPALTSNDLQTSPLRNMV